MAVAQLANLATLAEWTWFFFFFMSNVACNPHFLLFFFVPPEPDFSFASSVLYDSIELECTLKPGGMSGVWEWDDQGQRREDLPECQDSPECDPLHQVLTQGEANATYNGKYLKVGGVNFLDVGGHDPTAAATGSTSVAATCALERMYRHKRKRKRPPHMHHFSIRVCQFPKSQSPKFQFSELQFTNFCSQPTSSSWTTRRTTR